MIEKIFNSPRVINHIKKVVDNPAYPTKFLIGASVAKDAFEHGISTVQTLKNKEIPKGKRKLVAAMEAATGALTCISQLAVGFPLANKKVQNKIGNFLFKDFANKSPELKMGLAIALPLILSTVVVKRILVPMISAPIASYGTEFLAKQKNKDSES